MGVHFLKEHDMMTGLHQKETCPFQVIRPINKEFKYENYRYNKFYRILLKRTNSQKRFQKAEKEMFFIKNLEKDKKQQRFKDL